MKLIAQKAQSYDRVKFIAAHANAYSKAEWYINQLNKIFNVEVKVSIVDALPVLGVHTGPGMVGIAFIGHKN